MTPPPPPARRARPTRFAPALAASAALALHATPARAHFYLDEPACYAEQDAYGSPQKSAPCGQADPGQPVVETGAVTTYVEGQTITLTIHETIFHPGHYRVAIATDQASLPLDPPVTADATSACGAAAVDPAPALPVLADGLLEHTAAFNGPQTVQLTLPPGLTCTHCTLQVIEFMSNHALNNPGGCFYHHCANVTIEPRPGPDAGAGAGDAGDAGAGDAGVGDAGDADARADAGDAGPREDAGGAFDAGTTPGMAGSGCGCTAPARRGTGGAAVALAAAAALAARARRRRP